MTTTSNIEMPGSWPEFQVLAKNCPSRPVFEVITGRWSALTLLVLGEDPKRFSEIRREVDGINEKALAQSLRALERDGFVERHASDGYPSRVEYNLTGLGVSTTALLRGLVEHLQDRMPEVLEAQADYNRRHPDA
ncbi:winged helix-turn-helix transcriptional regulator [Glycomyces salinus]|uniref:winged helix-turn-helix transcriptional regulator n=1 Tax=Glycomyces salinus TaxID=980294 RepID=UPI0018EE0C7A|nr:helix-turn-helix domain-containing protein [Glycomyces salinus]